ncbi:MAG: solute:sodium symporter family transporter, partial [Lachnospiraceae bacterium]|nr:solute:sodium symporter family transporter [Lachnospiraceae bacterium]
CIYALYGGLKMVATADIINGALLLIGGALVVIFGFVYLGNGNFASGVTQVLTHHTEKMNAIGSPTDINPWATNMYFYYVCISGAWIRQFYRELFLQKT